jgi:hypothetical protein
MCKSDGPIRVVQYGWPDDSMASFWGRNCGPDPIMASNPTIVITLYGINNTQYKQVTNNTIKWYKNGLQRLIDTYRNNGVKTTLIGSPTAVELLRTNPGTGLMPILSISHWAY